MRERERQRERDRERERERGGENEVERETMYCQKRKNKYDTSLGMPVAYNVH